MSEYQCYEFVALDRPLTAREMTELRAISTRAEITPTRFWNEYHWGDLKANPSELLARYFDAHLYFANWGRRCLMLRLPAARIDVATLGPYFPGGPASIRKKGKHLILEIESDAEEPDEEWHPNRDLAALVPLRAQLLHGDFRGAYLAWLSAVQAGELGDDAVEPALPPGLADMPAPLQSFADFMRLDRDLIRAAAEPSGSNTAPAGKLRAWVRKLPLSEKHRWLLEAVHEPESPIGLRMLAAFRQDAPPKRSARTVAELRARAAAFRLKRGVT